MPCGNGLSRRASAKKKRLLWWECSGYPERKQTYPTRHDRRSEMTEPNNVPQDGVAVASEEADARVLAEKLTDALTPGMVVEFDPEQAEQAGAFVEDALSEQDAAESSLDLVNATAPAVSGPTEEEGHA
jgi:hypothetical protein